MGMSTYNLSTRKRVYARSKGKCGICGKTVDPLSFHVDHIIPVSKNGGNVLENLQLAHPACNQAKGAKTEGVRIPNVPMLNLLTIEAASKEVSLHYLKLQGAIEVRNRLILKAYEAGGVTLAELATAAGLSPQRIHQLVYDQNGDDNESH